MHDRLDHSMNEDAALAAALRALPAATPPADAWARLAARIVHRRRIRTGLRIALPAALAAGTVLAFAWPRGPGHQPSPPGHPVAQSAPAKAPAAGGLASLQAHSRQLQAWVHALDRDGPPLNGDALAQAVALQDRIGLIDLKISANRDPGTAASLWQQRNALLERLGLLHLQPDSVAEQHAAILQINTMVL